MFDSEEGSKFSFELAAEGAVHNLFRLCRTKVTNTGNCNYASLSSSLITYFKKLSHT